jgi:hypothetical protein
VADDSRGIRAAWSDPPLWIELFVLFNFGGLVVDIYFAHSTNQFRRAAEYIPLYFSIAAAVLMAVIVALRTRLPAVWRDVGYLIGWGAIAVGLAGVVLHLDSRFFEQRTLRSLTYAAPFAAPLAYTGLGLLLIANRMVPPRSIEWAQWMLLLALGGFVGNFVFSLTDHAQNGFFHRIEWLPVISSGFAVGFLLPPFLMGVGRAYLRLCALVLGVQALVGVVGFVLHGLAVARLPGTLLERVTSGAPPMAPLLFPNLVVLGLIAIFEWNRSATAVSVTE